MVSKPKTIQFRAQLPTDLDLLIRAIAPLKNGGKDWTLSDIAAEAFMDWLKKPENQHLIQQHNLLQALHDRGFDTTSYER
ncbi:hypothetical protein ACN4EG_21235 [Alkalinema pantanalense CENA528]|uniref:hypothetical protein n=1 Tax=Alkalinema pantanalense TaxID=1620705 RepID=UPI003D6F4A78